jgi:predicted TIM-barrel fold metal-dependent hydrolase
MAHTAAGRPRRSPTERTPYSYQRSADMDRAGIDRAILVPPSIDANRNDYAIEAVRKHPDRFAIMGKVPLKPAAPDILRGWREQPGMLGVRLTFHRDADRPWLSDGTADWFWPQAQFHDIPVMVHAPERLAEIGELAARYLPLSSSHGLCARDHGPETAPRPIA